MLVDKNPGVSHRQLQRNAYNKKVKGLFFARLETMDRVKKESPFVGQAACTACHQQADALWQASRHAKAIKTLERVGKQYDPECLACHVLGLEQGGFLSAELTPQFANVQCENCHGPSRAHAAQIKLPPGPPPGAPAPGAGQPTSQRPGEATCRTCHVGSHSPKFDFAIYWPKIVHPNPVPTRQ